ncbi:unnamed protein product [Arctogadus glacialis]
MLHKGSMKLILRSNEGVSCVSRLNGNRHKTGAEMELMSKVQLASPVADFPYLSPYRKHTVSVCVWNHIQNPFPPPG